MPHGGWHSTAPWPGHLPLALGRFGALGHRVVEPCSLQGSWLSKVPDSQEYPGWRSEVLRLRQPHPGTCLFESLSKPGYTGNHYVGFLILKDPPPSGPTLRRKKFLARDFDSKPGGILRNSFPFIMAGPQKKFFAPKNFHHSLPRIPKKILSRKIIQNAKKYLRILVIHQPRPNPKKIKIYCRTPCK